MDETEIISKESGEECYRFKQIHIGYFRTMGECEFVLYRTTYCPDKVLGYMITDDEDSVPMTTRILDAEKKPLSIYTDGEHKPNETRYHESVNFQPNEKLLAVFEEPYNAIVPCILKGPITPESGREDFEMNDTREYYDTYEDYVKDWDDWQWDSVEVHPLVKIRTEHSQMVDTMIVPRIYLFPYRGCKVD